MRCATTGHRAASRTRRDERKLASAQGGHHEALPRRIGLVMVPAAERDQLIQVEVGAAL